MNIDDQLHNADWPKRTDDSIGGILARAKASRRRLLALQRSKRRRGDGDARDGTKSDWLEASLFTDDDEVEDREQADLFEDSDESPANP